MTVLSVLAPPSVAAAVSQDQRRERAGCSNATSPPPPVDSSEVPPPGMPTPDPLPVPDEPLGGERMGECGLVAPPQAPPPPREVGAAGWIVAELGSGDVLAARNPHGRHRPASVIKILTALVAVRELEMSDTVTATRADAATEGSSVGLEPGVTYTVRQVLTGLILQSGNDAAHALARELGGRREAVRRMNELARELGATDTRAATVSGLDGPGMSTSAYDLALILRAALNDAEFAEIASTHRAELPSPPGQPPLRIASDSDVVLNYPGALFGKTGFTDDARHTRVVAAERGGHRLVAVLLRGEHRPVDMSEQAAALLDHGFRLTGQRRVGELVTRRTTTPTASAPGRTEEHPRQAAGPDEPRGLPPVVGFLGALLLAALAVLTAVVLHRRRTR
nr:D-alanyl-D-alanine carboxypeptidase family protein [Actinopolyspora biskrensis]